MKKKLLAECLNIAIKNNTPLKHPQWDCYKHFSFIIQNNKIIEWGTNRQGSAMIYLGYAPYQKIHSEVDAYFKARGIMDRNKPFEVINIRLNKTSHLKVSNPCKCCLAFLNHLGCKRIWYSTDNEIFLNISF